MASLLKFGCGMLGFMSITWSSLIAGTELPNVVVIFIDDMGYADIGPFGAQSLFDAESRSNGSRRSSFYRFSCLIRRLLGFTGSLDDRLLS